MLNVIIGLKAIKNARAPRYGQRVRIAPRLRQRYQPATPGKNATIVGWVIMLSPSVKQAPTNVHGLLRTWDRCSSQKVIVVKNGVMLPENATWPIGAMWMPLVSMKL